jgi:hypothetical protein
VVRQEKKGDEIARSTGARELGFRGLKSQDKEGVRFNDKKILETNKHKRKRKGGLMAWN